MDFPKIKKVIIEKVRKCPTRKFTTQLCEPFYPHAKKKLHQVDISTSKFELTPVLFFVVTDRKIPKRDLHILGCRWEKIRVPFWIIFEMARDVFN